MRTLTTAEVLVAVLACSESGNGPCMPVSFAALWCASRIGSRDDTADTKCFVPMRSQRWM